MLGREDEREEEREDIFSYLKFIIIIILLKNNIPNYY